LRSFGKTTNGKIFKIMFQKFSSRHWSTCCVQISWNLADGKSVKSCIAYLTKRNKQNFAWLSSCRFCADRAQNLPGPASTMYSRVLQISFKSVHFLRSNSRTREHRQRVNVLTSNITFLISGDL